MDNLDAILSVAEDLTGALEATDRYGRLLEALRHAIPYDAATLMRCEGEALVPLAARGLSPDALGRRFPIRAHPRLEIICGSEGPVRFPAESDLPDPFDGLLDGASGAVGRIHACLGCPLRVDGQLIGTLTADALAPRAFDAIEPRFLAALGALAAAALRTTDLLAALERSAERQGEIARDLMRDLGERGGRELLGTSAPLARLREEIDLVARTDLTVLITGETGSGKELVARALHAASARQREPMLYVNCAALPESLAESELFGHVRGAFTGASADRPGKFEIADGGTLFLDEIGELSAAVQPKLLRVLQEGEIQRVGTERPIRVNVRVLCATNRDLEAEVAAGRFRADLYHRIHVYSLRVPTLRERAADIALLSGFFCDEARRQLAVGPVRLAPAALEALGRYAWPGNVRELKNVLSRATLKAAVGAPRGAQVVIGPGHLGLDFAPGHCFEELDDEEAPDDLERRAIEEVLADIGTAPHAASAAASDVASTSGRPEGSPPTSIDLREATRAYQRALIRRALARSRGNWAAAARALGTSRSNLHHLSQRLGLKRLGPA